MPPPAPFQWTSARRPAFQDDPAWTNPKNKAYKSGTVVSHDKYRRYEMQRLRYYYAIAVFDSAATAQAVYQELDGMEIHHSSTFFDLRFVPDSMEFADEVRDSFGRAMLSPHLCVQTFNPLNEDVSP